MTKNEIIAELFHSKEFDDCINSRCPEHLKDDLKAEILLLICEKEETQIIDLHTKNQLKFFVVRIILNQLNKTGQFYKKYRKIICVDERETEAERWGERYGGQYTLGIKSTFDKLFNTPSIDEPYTDRLAKEQFEDKLMFHVEQLHWYKAGLFKLYLELGTFRAVAKLTRIPFTSVHLTLKEASREIREKLCK